MKVPCWCLICCLRIWCPCQKNALHVRFIKNSVLKFHSCFNSRCVAPSPVQNLITEAIDKQKTNDTAGQESALCSPVSWSWSLKMLLASCVCADEPAHPPCLPCLLAHVHTNRGYCGPEQMTLRFSRVNGTGSILAICSEEMPTWKLTWRVSLGQTAWSAHPSAATKGTGNKCSVLRKAEDPETCNLSSSSASWLSTFLARDKYLGFYFLTC